MSHRTVQLPSSRPCAQVRPARRKLLSAIGGRLLAPNARAEPDWDAITG